MASEIRVNQIQNRSGLSTVTFSDTGAIVSGIVTANNFSGNITGAVTGNVTGNLSGDIVGTRTLGTGVTVTAAGVVSATTYYGSGANLTGITGTTINNNGSNRIITGSGTANTLEGESTFTYDGVNKAKIDTSQTYAMLQLDGNSGGAIEFYENGTRRFEIYGIDAGIEIYDRDKGAYHSKFLSGGDFEISDGNLKFASGHGIDFGATGGPAEGSGSSELFDDYEEGTFTPVWKFDPTNATSVTYSIQNGKYVKIGGVVFIRIELQVSNKGSLPSGAGWAQIDGLPYACSEYSAVSIGIYQHFNNVQPGIAHVGTSEQVYIAYDPSLSSNTSSYDLQHTNFTNNSRINISGTYYAV